jgi:uncharacterized protein (TIGR00369 family)
MTGAPTTAGNGTRLVDLIARAKAERDLNLFQQAIPYARYIGITTAEEADGQLITSLPFSDKIVGNPALPAIHGGVVGAFLETAAILQLLWTLEAIRVPKTITITIDYLRSARAEETFASATVTKLGARVANVRAFAWQAERDKPVAGLNANFLVTPAD